MIGPRTRQSQPSTNNRTTAGGASTRKRGVADMLSSDVSAVQAGGSPDAADVHGSSKLHSKKRRMTHDGRSPPQRRPVGRPPKRPVGRPPRTVTFRDDVRPQRFTASAALPAPVSGHDDANAHHLNIGNEKVSTKAVTALAVNAALESAKAVLAPLNDRLSKLLAELNTVSKDLVLQKKALDLELQTRQQPPVVIDNVSGAVNVPGEVEGKDTAGAEAEGAVISSKVSLAALENFQLDVSEIIGGGEARIRAYSSLSQQEFEGLHRLIEQQGKSLREMDRLLYAAQAFAEKSKAKDPNGPKDLKP